VLAESPQDLQAQSPKHADAFLGPFGHPKGLLVHLVEQTPQIFVVTENSFPNATSSHDDTSSPSWEPSLRLRALAAPKEIIGIPFVGLEEG
jgi:hypothetical protein